MQTARATKQPLLQCKFCATFYPPEYKQTLITHLQYHIEQSTHQQPGNHICPWNQSKCKKRFLTAELMAIHTMEYHTKTRYTSITSRRYTEAYDASQNERSYLIKLISEQENTPQRLFFPKPNANEPDQ